LQLALRPYAAAGVALVAAGVIAATPVIAPAPEIQSHPVHLTAAIDNPVDVFRPVVDRAGALIQDAIQAEIDNPFPIISGLIGRAALDGQALGDIANSMGQIITTLATSFPAAFATAVQRAANGDFSGAVNAFVPAFMGPFIGTFQQVLKLQTFVKDRFVLAGELAAQVVIQAWALGPGQALGLFSIVGAVTGTLDELWKAVPSGDLGRVVNAIQHGAANLATATLSLVDTWRFSLDAARTNIRNILNPPPPDPEESLTSAAVADVQTPALLSAVAPSAVKTSAPVARAAAASGVSESATAPAEVTEPGNVTTQVRLSPKAGRAVTGSTTESSDPRTTVSNSVRDALKNVPGGIKHVTAGAGGKQSTSETSSSSTGSSSKSGSGKHDSE
jgi:hypothetical protein